MPRIFDNIDESLLHTLRSALDVANRADFCVGYFNLRGWRKVDDLINKFAGGEGACCRLLVGMQKLPQEELHESRTLLASNTGIDNTKVLQFKKQVAKEFREQLILGTPTNEDEQGLRCLSTQLKAKQVVIKLFLKHTLHAKLYLLHRTDPHNPTIGILGSSNLTLSGLEYQGELNVDVLDHDACHKLQNGLTIAGTIAGVLISLKN